MATQALLTVEQFLDLPDRDDRVRELDRGQPLEMAPPSLEHSETITRLLYALVDFVKRSSLDLTVSQGAGFALTPDTMRVPDVFVVEESRVRVADVIRGGWLQISPDLAVEVVSPNDSAADLEVKIHQYLDSGTKTVWVVYPQTRRVMIYRGSGVRAELSEEMALTDPGLLPGFSIPISDIFPKLDAG